MAPDSCKLTKQLYYCRYSAYSEKKHPPQESIRLFSGGNYFRRHNKWCVSDRRKPRLLLIIVSLPHKYFVHCYFEFSSTLWHKFRRTSQSPWLTLTRGLEAEGLEAPGEGRGVDDINAVLALAPSVKSDSDDQKHHRHHPRSEA